jgi:hypothetical protein
MSDYRDGFTDGVNFAREVIIDNLRQWAEDHDSGEVLDWVADRLERGDARD